VLAGNACDIVCNTFYCRFVNGLSSKVLHRPVKKNTISSQQQSYSAEEHTEPSNCPVCEEVIKEPTDKVPGHEAIFCEGQCEAWFHCKCAGILKKVYESTSESDNPFYCRSCLQTHFYNEISQLKQHWFQRSLKIKVTNNFTLWKCLARLATLTFSHPV